MLATASISDIFLDRCEEVPAGVPERSGSYEDAHSVCTPFLVGHGMWVIHYLSEGP